MHAGGYLPYRPLSPLSLYEVIQRENFNITIHAGEGYGKESIWQAIQYCGDTYKVTTADGKTRDFWERNLRFKTDSSNDGPEKNAPALIDAGMMGDRADVIFADPQEITPIIKHECGEKKP